MSRRNYLLPTVLVAATFLIYGCGSSTNRMLTSIAVAPANAHASGSTAVQFTAIGTFSASPITITPLPANWSFSGFTTIPESTVVTIDSNGLAHCNGFKGTIPIYAVHPVNPNTPPPAQISPSNGSGLIGGTSSLTCD